MSSFSSKTEHRSRGDNREQKGPIAVVAPPFPPFPAICSQKRQGIKDRHLLPVSLSLQLPHTNTFNMVGPKCDRASQVPPHQAGAGTTELTLKTISSVMQVTAFSRQPQVAVFNQKPLIFHPWPAHICCHSHTPPQVLHIHHSGCRGSTLRTIL